MARPIQWSRRELLQIGGIGALGLGLPELLSAESTATGKKSHGSGEKSCIFIVQYGGAPHLDTFDLKPDAPAEMRGPYRPIDTNVPGTRICDRFPRLATMADRFCLVRSMTHGNSDHVGAMHMTLSGQSSGLRTDNRPYFGSMMAKLRPAVRNVPPYVWVQNMHPSVERYERGGALGALYAPMRIGQDHDNPSAPEFRVKAFDPVPGMTVEHLRERFELLEHLDPEHDSLTSGNPGVAALRRFQRKGRDLLIRPEAKAAFDINLEPQKARDRYGAHPLGQNLLLARRLIESGVRLVSVTAWTGVPKGHRYKNAQTWDMHGGGLGSIFGNGPYGLDWCLPVVDEAVSALLEDLDQRGMLDNTLVVMVGEFGRTPKITKAVGRDHWPNVYSALLAGSGIRGGMVHGASDEHAATVKDKPVSPENFGASLFHALGVPPETRFGPDVASKVTQGQPIRELFG